MKIKNKFYSFNVFFVLLLFIPSIIFSQISHSVSFPEKSLQISLFISENGEEYEELKMDELISSTYEVGAPDIPVKIVKLIIPAGQEVSNIIISTSNKEIMELQRLIKPVQYPIFTSINNEKKPFVEPDKKYYESDNPYPDKPVKVLYSGYFDGTNHIVAIAVCPLQYFPKENKLEFFKDISFSLEMTTGSRRAVFVNSRSDEKQEHINAILENLVDNPWDISIYQVKHKSEGVLAKTTTTPTGSYKYVVVTTSALSQYFDKFIQWKNRKGVRAYIKTIEEILNEYPDGDQVISGGLGIDDDAGSLRQFLYETWQNNDIDYALLAGDIDHIPFRYGCGYKNTWDKFDPLDDYEHIPADLYFADFNGDWNVDDDIYTGELHTSWPTEADDNPDYYSEIYVGRLLFSTYQEVLNWTDKLIEYEQNPFKGDYSNITKFLWSISDEPQGANLANLTINRSSTLPGFTNTIKKEEPAYDSYNPTAPTGAGIILELNNGYHFYNIYNHGAPTDINVRCPGNHDTESGGPFYGIITYDALNPGWYQYETGNGLDNITSNNSSTIIYSIACSNAQFDYSGNRCMADVFTVLNNSGGVAFIGNTRLGVVGISDYFHQSFIYRILDDDPRYDNLGEALGVSKTMVSVGNRDHHYHSYNINLFGDPEMSVWSTTPSQFSGVSITITSNSVTVNTGVSGCDITACSIDNGSTYYSMVNGSSATFSTSVRPLYITVTKPDYIPYSTITGGILNTDATLWGKLNVLSTITVASGKTLTIEHGTTLRFASGASLILNGGLSAVGISDKLIKLTSLSGTSQSSWGSIVFSGSGASGSTLEYTNIKYGTRVEANNNASNITIQYCNIDTTYDGVYFNGATGSILNNNITTNSIGAGIRIEGWSGATCNDNIVTKTGGNRTGTGILYGGGSGGYVARNDIYHWNWGMGAIWDGSPISYSETIQCNNRIKKCYSGVVVYRNSDFLFGAVYSSHYGNNSLDSNTINVSVGMSYTSYPCTLLAHDNWWGDSPPNTQLFSVGPNADFSYDYYLQTDPCSGMGKMVAGNNGSSSGGDDVSKSSSNNIEPLIPGIELRREKKYSEAKDFFISFIANHPENQAAYVELYNCYSKETASDLINYFSSLPKEASKDHKLLLAYLYLKNGNVKEAKEVNNTIIEENPNTELGTKAKLNNVYITLYNEGNINDAVAIFNEVMNKAELSTTLELNLVYQDIEIYGKTYGIEIKGLTVPPKLDYFEEELPKQEVSAKTEIPDKYSLVGNYPNPFNPSTTISYALPYQSTVELIIYDIIGRVVKSFNISSQSAGYQSIVWDGRSEIGTSVASGIYLYRISIKSLENNETFVKTAKLVLMK